MRVIPQYTYQGSTRIKTINNLCFPRPGASCARYTLLSGYFVDRFTVIYIEMSVLQLSVCRYDVFARFFLLSICT